MSDSGDSSGDRKPWETDDGLEDVHKYPRPPAVEPVSERVRVIFNGETIADTTSAYRVLETTHPPSYYIPAADVDFDFVTKASGSSYCEWKGSASYWTVHAGNREAVKSAWSYAEPTPGFEAIADHLAFYCSRMSECWVGDEQATAQDGDFYGSWITSNLKGPFKGGPGTMFW